jgi:hypothetical protein
VARDPDTTKTNDGARRERPEGVEDLFSLPPPSIDDLFEDALVRCRIGERISLAVNRAASGRRARRRRRGSLRGSAGRGR